MELENVWIESPPRHTRLCGEVIYETGTPRREIYWLDVPAGLAPYLSDSGNPWLAWLLPVAAVSGETLRLSRPVDPELLENARELLEIWRCWYPEDSTRISIDAACYTPSVYRSGGDNAAFFSGGVDSLFTAACQRRAHLDDLIYVCGLIRRDFALVASGGMDHLCSDLEKAASHFNANLLVVRTNLLTTRFGRATSLIDLSQGCALGGIALGLEKKYRRVLISSSGASYRRLGPNGTHPLTDRLVSTATTKIVPYGANFERLDKAQWLTDHEGAKTLSFLCVCGESPTGKNCGGCEKCLRTMLVLELCGSLKVSKIFPDADKLFERFQRVYITSVTQRREYEDIRRRALESGRADITSAMETSIQRSRWLDAARALIDSLREPPARPFTRADAKLFDALWKSPPPWARRDGTAAALRAVLLNSDNSPTAATVHVRDLMRRPNSGAVDKPNVPQPDVHRFLNRLERALLSGSICSYFLAHRSTKADEAPLMYSELEAKRAARKGSLPRTG